MSVIFEKSRNKYLVRVTHKGTRHYIGRYKTFTEAEAAEARWKAVNERPDPPSHTLEGYTMNYEFTERQPIPSPREMWRRLKQVLGK